MTPQVNLPAAPNLDFGNIVYIFFIFSYKCTNAFLSWDFRQRCLICTSVTSLCICRIEAGTRGVTGPKNASLTISALSSPLTMIRIFFACMIVPIPIVYACLGTSSADAKKRLFASIVLSVRSTQCVVLSNASAGSLNPI